MERCPLDKKGNLTLFPRHQLSKMNTYRQDKGIVHVVLSNPVPHDLCIGIIPPYT